MENQAVTKKSTTPIDFFKREDVKNKFIEVMGKRGNAFTSSVLTLISNNDKLKHCKSESIYMCAMMAATLDLPLNPNLGFAYLVPYGDTVQFQLGYRAFIQFAMRSGQFKTISASPIYKGQLISEDPLKGFEFDFSVQPADKNEKPIGYAAYFSLINGFEKTLYLSIDKVEAHGKKYSKTFSNGPWKSDFDAMATKTVIKMLLSKYAPLSVEMQTAQIVDQAEIKDVDTLDVSYVDEGKSVIGIEDLQFLFSNKLESLPKDINLNIQRIIDNKEEANYAKAYAELESFVPAVK